MNRKATGRNLCSLLCLEPVIGFSGILLTCLDCTSAAIFNFHAVQNTAECKEREGCLTIKYRQILFILFI